MKKIELEIVALSHSVTHSHNYAVVLGEVHGSRRLPIVIGAFEAQAIAVAMERMAPNRPLTHDLFKNTLQTFSIELKEIIINNLLDGIFYSKMICVKDGETFEVDSRTSDALAMAVRYDCPIFTYEFILEVAGVILEEPESIEEPVPPKKKGKKNLDTSLSQYSYEELSTMLNEVLANENYERAAQIRDELNKREKG